jgi:DNA polymerase III subunit epsilon
MPARFFRRPGLGRDAGRKVRLRCMVNFFRQSSNRPQYGDSQVPLFDRPVIFVDVETSGGSPTHERIIEIGMLRLEPDGRRTDFSSLVRPGKFVPPFILSLTGIDPEALSQAPDFCDIAADVRELLEGAIFAAHNARFDYAFVKNEMRRLGIPYSAQTFCSAQFSRSLYPEYRRHDLSSLIERFGLIVHNRHRAFDDAQAILDFLEKAAQDRPDTFKAVCRRFLERRSAQTLIPEERMESLPDAPGVYLFYGKNGEVLYVGKSRNIRERVMDHFYTDHERGRGLAMLQQTADLEVRRTAGEFSALLLEARLVKELSPIFNRMLRRRDTLIVARREKDGRGFWSLRLEEASQQEIAGREIVGYYKTMSAAKRTLAEIAGREELCPKLLGLEKTRRACFSFHLKRCRGACSGRESAEDYNRRFENAFALQELERWPFPSPVVIDEYDPIDKFGEVFVLNDWKVMACIRYEGEDQVISHRPAEFDIDTYQLIRSLLKKPFPGTRIKPISEVQARAMLAGAEV